MIWDDNDVDGAKRARMTVFLNSFPTLAEVYEQKIESIYSMWEIRAWIVKKENNTHTDTHLNLFDAKKTNARLYV